MGGSYFYETRILHNGVWVYHGKQTLQSTYGIAEYHFSYGEQVNGPDGYFSITRRRNGDIVDKEIVYKKKDSITYIYDMDGCAYMYAPGDISSGAYIGMH